MELHPSNPIHHHPQLIPSSLPSSNHSPISHLSPHPFQQPIHALPQTVACPITTTIPTRIHPDGLREVPAQFERCEVVDLVELIASMLNRLITHNDQIPLSSTSLTRFHSRSPPSISIQDYLNRIYRYTSPEPICLVLILSHIDRICDRLANFTICSLTVHRFCITSVTVGAKTICDSFYANSRYAKVGGIGLAEMNLLEREFLLAIDYRLMITIEELNRYYFSLVQSHPNYRLRPQDPIPPSFPCRPSSQAESQAEDLPPLQDPKQVNTMKRKEEEDKGEEEAQAKRQASVPASPDCIQDD